MMNWTWGSWGMGFGLVFMVLLWLLVVLGVVALIRWLGGGSLRETPHRTPLDILKERYARGEIGREEFQQKWKDLTE